MRSVRRSSIRCCGGGAQRNPLWRAVVFACCLRQQAVEIPSPYFPHIMVLGNGSRDLGVFGITITCCDCERSSYEESGAQHGKYYDAERVYGIAHVVALLHNMSNDKRKRRHPDIEMVHNLFPQAVERDIQRRQMAVYSMVRRGCRSSVSLAVRQ